MNEQNEMRDLYAGLAMLGEVSAKAGRHELPPDLVAARAFDMADAMVREATKRDVVPEGSLEHLQAELAALSAAADRAFPETKAPSGETRTPAGETTPGQDATTPTTSETV